MFDVTAVKKHKITLSDYNYQRDIENRLLLSQFSEFDHAVLEEILFSPIRTPIRKMTKNLNCSEEELLPVLQKFSQTGLLAIEDDSVIDAYFARSRSDGESCRYDCRRSQGLRWHGLRIEKPQRRFE